MRQIPRDEKDVHGKQEKGDTDRRLCTFMGYKSVKYTRHRKGGDNRTG
jgi:hypothetical protein